jgi:hypothetical protein
LVRKSAIGVVIATEGDRRPTQHERRHGALACVSQPSSEFFDKDKPLTTHHLPSMAAAVLSFRPAFGCFVPARRPGECVRRGILQAATLTQDALSIIRKRTIVLEDHRFQRH